MYKTFNIAFFGHRYIERQYKLRGLLKEYVTKLLNENEYVNFLVGRNGEFDSLVSSTVIRVHKDYKCDNSSLILILPYPTSEYMNNKEYFEDYYNEIIISPSASKAHPKAAMQIRNREMVDLADLIICYIDNKNGGAYQTMRYAMKREKPIINLADACDY